MNCVAIIGRLTDDPKPFYDQKNGGDLAFCAFTVAVSKQGKGTEKMVDFIPCTAFDHNAKFAMAYFKKGMRVGVQGMLHSTVKKTKSGDVIYPVSVTTKQLDFADGKEKMGEVRQSSDGKTEDFMHFVDVEEGSQEGVVFN